MELLQKLKLKQEQPLWLINAPDDCNGLFDGFNIIKKTGKDMPAGQLLLFVTSSDELYQSLVALDDYIGTDTLFWICYPKKSGTISSDLEGMKTWEGVLQMGYRGQSSASVNDDWSALRLTKAPKVKATLCDLPMDERKVEGIDFVKRTVQLPADALAAVDAFKGMAAYFDSLSFTTKKEYVIAITESKKPETRIRRIEKMVRELGEKMQVRALKQK